MRCEALRAVGHIPSGLYIVVVEDRDSGVIDGFLGSWIQQISFIPPLVTMGMKPGRPAYDLISKGVPFSINIVGEHDKSFLKHFWKGYDPAENPFKELGLQRFESGTVFLNQAKSALECQLVSSSKPGDHDLVVAEVLASFIISEEAKSMVHLRKTGASY